MPTCPRCGAAHPPGASFCPACGAALAATCPSCGADVVPGAAYCFRCGTRLPVEEGAPRPSGPSTVPSPRPVPATEERKVVTILFADVVGSTALAERLDPETMRELLRAFFEAMRAEIEAERGTVEKFVGDAVMAAFGVPFTHEDDPERAVRAGRAMVRRLEELNPELERTYGVALSIRVGINTGSVLATLDGPPGEGIVTGDPVNVAARLQNAAQPGQVLVSERTARAARSFGYEDRGGLELKGKREPVRAFAVSGPASGHSRGFTDLRAPMVGRDAEMGVLASVLERTTRERRPHLVTVYGEPGVGKSRLVREFVEHVQEEDPAALVMRGRCLPYGDGVAYWPLAEILKGQAAVRDSDQTAVALGRIQAAVAELLEDDVTGADPDTTAAALAYTLGLTDPDAPLPTIDPLAVRKQLHAAWRTFFSAAASRGPVVVVVEDIHWADEAMLDLLEELADRVEGPVLFVCPSRPDLSATRPGWGGGRRNAVSVALDRLDESESERLVRLLLDVDDLPGSVHARILERGEGNPFFIEEILRRLIDERLVVRDGSRWRAMPGVETVEIPDTVQGVLAARIDLLDAGDKRVLQAAAVVGRTFWTEPVHLLAGDGTSLEAELERLEERDLVQARLGSALAGQAEYAFKHILTRDVAYDGIPRRERSGAHAEVARWLERTTAERSGEFSELLAYHYATAVELAQDAGMPVGEELRGSAWTWLLRASGDSRCRHLVGRAQRLAQEALELAVTDLERVDALESLGLAYYADSRGDMAWQYLREAALAADASADVDGVRAAYLMARACEIPVRWPGMMRAPVPEPEVRALLDRGLALVPAGDDAVRAALLGVKASWPFAFPGTMPREAAEEYRLAGIEGTEIALRLGDWDLASGVLDQASAADFSRGDFGTALGLWQRRWELRDRLTADLEVGDVYAMGAWIHYELGRYEESVDYARQAVGRAPAMGGGVHASSWETAALFRLGRWDDALRCYSGLREELDDRRDHPPNYALHAYSVAALIHLLRGQRLEGDRIAAVVESMTTPGARAFPWKVWLRLARSDLDGAQHLLDHMPSSWEVHAGIVNEARCDAALVVGDWERAAALATEVRAYAEYARTPTTTAFADRLDGATALGTGRTGDALTLLTRASAAFDRLAVPYERARTQLLLATALEGNGRADEGERARAAGQATLEQLGVAGVTLLGLPAS